MQHCQASFVARTGRVTCSGWGCAFPLGPLAEVAFMCASWVSCLLNLNVYKPLSVQFIFLHCQHLHFLTLLKAQQRQLFPPLQPMPASSHLLLCILFCQGAGVFGGQPSRFACPDTGIRCVSLPETSCPYQHLQEWSTVEALRCVVALPTPAFLLPHGYFSQELLSCCFWLVANVPSWEMGAISW